MAYFRQRRADRPYQPAFQPPQDDDDRVYTEEDYGVKEPPAESIARTQAVAPMPQAAPSVVPIPSARDEAFAPDEEESRPGAYAPPQGAYPPDDAEDYGDGYDDYDDFDDYDDDPLAEDLLTEEERAALRRSRWRLIAGLADFAGVIAGTAAILVLVALLVSLLNWLHADILQTFTLWQTKL